MGTKEKFIMKSYVFSVIFGSHFERFFIDSKTLSSALKSLKSEIEKKLSGFSGSYNWVVCRPYTLISDSGRSTRLLRKVVKGVS